MPVRHKTWGNAAAVAVAGLGCALAALPVLPAMAAENDPLKYTLSETLTYDDNVFRRPSILGTSSDTIAATNLKVSYDKDYSRQHLQVIVSYTDNRYQRLSALNNVGSLYSLGWRGAFPGQLSTDTSLVRSQSLANFADVRNLTSKDVIIAESANFRLSYLPHPDWPVYAAETYNKSTNSAFTLSFNDVTTTTSEIGAQYNSPLGNQLSVLARLTDGDYPNLPSVLGNAFRQRDVQGGVSYRPGIKSTVSLQIGHTTRTLANLPQRDFSGVTGHLNLDWAPTLKTSFYAVMGRDVSPVTAFSVADFALANYALVQSYTGGMRWAPTPKLSTDTRVWYLIRHYGGTPGDTTSGASFILRYVPMTALQMSLQLNHEVRESDNPLLPYRSNTGSFNVTFTY